MTTDTPLQLRASIDDWFRNSPEWSEIVAAPHQIDVDEETEHYLRDGIPEWLESPSEASGKTRRDLIHSAIASFRRGLISEARYK